MMIRRLIMGVLVTLLILPIVCQAGENGVPVIITGSYRGRIDGCRCQGSYTGGLGRYAALLQKELGTENPVGLDCGRILDLDFEGGRERSRCTIFGLARTGLKVIGVAPRDLFYGVDFLRQTADSAEIELVSANLIDAETNLPLFGKWTTVSANGIKLAVTSLVSYQPGRRYTLPIGWTAVSPDSVIDDLIEQKPAGADYTILLTDMAESELQVFITSHPQFDLAFTSSRKVSTPSPFYIGACMVARPEADGRFLSWIEFKEDRKIEFFSRPLSNNLSEDKETTKWLRKCLGRE